ncbi:unnamed protein product [marine sediment metagenome]|uniref:riboflavin kinase n=1 Tax=marine sediment metagenome TaxID=412755 RepID=X1A5Y0_9ZZZZ
MLVEKINNDFPALDFVLFGGDNFNNNVSGNGDAAMFRKIIDELHCPSYVKTPHGRFKGAVNIGMNPTFGGNKLCIETHIFDFDKDIYGKEISIFFVKKIRGEKKFKDAESLALQIKKDVSFINRVLKEKL